MLQTKPFFFQKHQEALVGPWLLACGQSSADKPEGSGGMAPPAWGQVPNAGRSGQAWERHAPCPPIPEVEPELTVLHITIPRGEAARSHPTPR